MENQRRTKNFSQVFFTSGGNGFNRLVLMCLGLLNLVLLIIAVVLGTYCARVKDGSFHISHSTVTQLINELDYLHSNHSDVIEAEEEAKKALERALKHHQQLKEQIEQQKIISDGYMRQIETLRTEKTSLQSNISALEGTCGRCLPGWSIHNTSCYFFSYVQSSTEKKNWPDSRADCISRGSDLVVIDNQEEQEFVSNSIKSVARTPNDWQNGVWIGLTDTETEGTWVWINNVTEVEQRYWMNGEPNNHGLEGENCGIAAYTLLNPWKTRYDGNCHEHQLYWTCEMPSR